MDHTLRQVYRLIVNLRMLPLYIAQCTTFAAWDFSGWYFKSILMRGYYLLSPVYDTWCLGHILLFLEAHINASFRNGPVYDIRCLGPHRQVLGNH